MKILDLIAKSKKAGKKKAAKNVAVGVGIGTAVGIAAGALLAPKSGKETREQIAKGAAEAAEKLKITVEETKDKLQEIIEKKKGCCCEEENCCQTETETETKDKE